MELIFVFSFFYASVMDRDLLAQKLKVPSAIKSDKKNGEGKGNLPAFLNASVNWQSGWCMGAVTEEGK